MKRPEQPTKINEIDYRGKTAPALMTADVLLPIPAPSPPPPTVSDTFPILAFDRLSLLQRRRCQAAWTPRTYSTGQLETCYLYRSGRVTLVPLNVRSSES